MGVSYLLGLGFGVSFFFLKLCGIGFVFGFADLGLLCMLGIMDIAVDLNLMIII